MVKIRKASKTGVTAKFARGRFSITHHGTTEYITVDTLPRDDSEIMHVLASILDQY